MIADALLTRLNGVRRAGPERWLAKCPAHHDRHPSLSIREVDDKVLVNCFAGCGALEVLNAVGLDYSVLFSEKPDHCRRLPRPVFSQDTFELVRHEASVVWLIGCDMHNGKSLSGEDYARLAQALGKLERVAELAYGS